MDQSDTRSVGIFSRSTSQPPCRVTRPIRRPGESRKNKKTFSRSSDTLDSSMLVVTRFAMDTLEY
eukprot:2581251-Pyramimonas_sp.AAC.1